MTEEIRREFEKAFDDSDWSSDHDFGLALWAAKWMAERIARDAEPYSVMLTERIRHLSKGLET